MPHAFNPGSGMISRYDMHLIAAIGLLLLGTILVPIVAAAQTAKRSDWRPAAAPTCSAETTSDR